MSEFDFISKMQSDIPEDVRIYVKKSMDILDRLHELMEDKGIMQKQLAEKMGKTEAEISKWLNGVQNFTLKTLSKLEAALGSPIIEVPCRKNSVRKFLLIESNRLETKNPLQLDFEKFEPQQNPQTEDHANAA